MNYVAVWDQFANEAIYARDRDAIAPPERYLVFSSFDGCDFFINHYEQDGMRLDYAYIAIPPTDMEYLYLKEHGFEYAHLVERTIPYGRFVRILDSFGLVLEKCVF